MSQALISDKSFLTEGVQSAIDFIRQWQDYMPDYVPDETLSPSAETFADAWTKFTEKIMDNYPFFHPLYAGQMLKPPHPIAVIGYLSAMLINPNNHALDGGPATAAMEKEVVAMFAKRFGFGEEFLGHLTSSGTIANLEALWVSRQIHPDKKVAYSAQSHYTHHRMLGVLNTDGIEIHALPNGKMDIEALKTELKTGAIGTVVATLGTTGLGALDPLAELVALKSEFNFRIHVDMAYGGYYHLLKSTETHLQVFDLLSQVDSLVIDPHKHGLQPYGCGCVLFNDPAVQKHYLHDSPYTYYTATDEDLHLGEISLECSRAGAAAAALWLTLQCFPLEETTGMGAILQKTRNAAKSLTASIQQSPDYKLYLEPELDIVTLFAKAKTTSRINRRTRAIFHHAMSNVDFPLFLALLKVKASDFQKLHPEFEVDSEEVLLLRSCLMKPEHADWSGQIFQILHHHAQIVRDEI